MLLPGALSSGMPAVAAMSAALSLFSLAYCDSICFMVSAVKLSESIASMAASSIDSRCFCHSSNLSSAALC